MSRYRRNNNMEERLMKGAMLALIFGPYIALVIGRAPIWLYLITPSIHFSILIGLAVFFREMC